MREEFTSESQNLYFVKDYEKEGLITKTMQNLDTAPKMAARLRELHYSVVQDGDLKKLFNLTSPYPIAVYDPDNVTEMSHVAKLVLEKCGDIAKQDPWFSRSVEGQGNLKGPLAINNAYRVDRTLNLLRDM